EVAGLCPTLRRRCARPSAKGEVQAGAWRSACAAGRARPRSRARPFAPRRAERHATRPLAGCASTGEVIGLRGGNWPPLPRPPAGGIPRGRTSGRVGRAQAHRAEHGTGWAPRQYFGKRYLNPLLGRWISADPLAVHAPGWADLNLYAYVRGY